MEYDCFLCAPTQLTTDLYWYDRPLWLDPRAGLVVAGIGGLTPGYVLVAPIAHHASLRRAAASAGSAFTSFIAETLDFLEERLGSLTFWEHGSPAIRTSTGSACIDHAHLHVVPGLLDLPAPPSAERFATLADALTSEGSVSSTDGYLLVGSSSGHVALGSDVPIPQYYRREWARLLGRGDEWDYLLAEDAKITAETSALLFGRDEV